MDKETLQRTGPALDLFLEDFAGCAVAPTRRLIATYVRGQLGSLPRKSIKPIALSAGIAPRTLQELLSLHRWDEDLLIALLQRRVRRARLEAPPVGLLFETHCVKKGDRTPGVTHQAADRMARPRNCVVFVHLAFSAGTFHCLLDSALYLPPEWTGNNERREAAGVPAELQPHSKTELALALLRRAEANGVPLRRLVLPTAYARETAFCESLRMAGRSFATTPSRGESEPLFSGVPDEERRPLARAGLEARESLEETLDRIGLDHFEVRTWRSLTRHLALSALSALFLAEQGDRSRREREPLAARTRA